MSVPGENRQNPDWPYYYALYHMLAHWAAFLGVFVLLVTFGVQWNTTQNPRVAHPYGAALGLVVLCAVELWLVWCIFRESTYLLRKLPISTREPELIEPLHGHPKLIFLVLGLGIIAFTFWDVSLVLGWL
jgi:hypothetical protein